MKNYLLIVVIFLVAVFLWLKEGGGINKTKDGFVGNDLSGDNTVTCTFERTTGVSYEDNKIIHESPRKEKNALVMTFTDLNTEAPRLQAGGASSTTYGSSLAVLSRTRTKISLGEITPTERNIFIYSIFRDKGVAIWTKHYSMFDVPLGVISMGKCR